MFLLQCILLIGEQEISVSQTAAGLPILNRTKKYVRCIVKLDNDKTVLSEKGVLRPRAQFVSVLLLQRKHVVKACVSVNNDH